VAVFLASMKSHAVGASLAFAIALHNVPEVTGHA
jgi:ZIP family zinc transporter